MRKLLARLLGINASHVETLRKVQDDVYCIPVINCPECHHRSQPLTSDPQIGDIYYCSNCSYVPDPSEIIGYVTEKEAIIYEAKNRNTGLW